MQFTFNASIAQKYGVDEAIMLENIYFWILKNKANKRHEYDGDYWTYNSARAFEEVFPFWTRRQIERIIKSLKEKRLIKTGNYNKSAYDRTTWYALTEISKFIYAFPSMNIAETVNQFPEKVQPIPYNKPYSKQDSKQDIYSLVLDYLNKKCNTSYKATTKKTKDFIKARLNEKFVIEDFYKVIDIKSLEWLGTDMEKYLRPETLFGTKFESYLNQKRGATNGATNAHGDSTGYTKNQQKFTGEIKNSRAADPTESETSTLI